MAWVTRSYYVGDFPLYKPLVRMSTRYLRQEKADPAVADAKTAEEQEERLARRRRTTRRRSGVRIISTFDHFIGVGQLVVGVACRDFRRINLIQSLSSRSGLRRDSRSPLASGKHGDAPTDARRISDSPWDTLHQGPPPGRIGTWKMKDQVRPKREIIAKIETIRTHPAVQETSNAVLHRFYEDLKQRSLTDGQHRPLRRTSSRFENDLIMRSGPQYAGILVCGFRARRGSLRLCRVPPEKTPPKGLLHAPCVNRAVRLAVFADA